VRRFFSWVTSWHRRLGRQGESQAAGRAITGACNLAFLFLVTSGFYIWWPRNWTWQRFRQILWFRRELNGRARDFNWHNVIGIWCCVPLFLVVISGVVLSYDWAGNLVYRLAGSEPPPAPAARAAGPAGRDRSNAARPQPGEASLEGLSEYWIRVQQQVPGWQTITLRWPPSSGETLTFAVEQGGRGRVDLRSQLTLSRATGEVVGRQDYQSLSAGRRVRLWLRFLHTGEAGGLPGQTIAGIASAGGAVLVWTGLMMALRRLRGWQARRYSRKNSLLEQEAFSEELSEPVEARTSS
jgi:uncharacterized iron-regulated membrane protein